MRAVQTFTARLSLTYCSENIILYNRCSLNTVTTYTSRITVITDMRTGDTNDKTPVQFNNNYYTYIPFVSDTVSTAMVVDLIWTSPTACKAFV